MIKINNKKCDLCGTCVAVCPEDCIDLFETFLSIDNEICINCQKCVKVCAFEALWFEKNIGESIA